MHKGAGVALLLDNRWDDQTLAAHLLCWLPAASEAAIQVAYLRVSGIELIREALRELSARGANLRVLTCGDFAQTEPPALEFLRGLGGACEVRMVASTGLWGFHPKCYLLRRPETTVLVVGSSNFTAGGLQDNIELNLALELPHEHETIAAAQAIFDRLWDATPPLTDESLADYTRFWQEAHGVASRLIYRTPGGSDPSAVKEEQPMPDHVDPSELQPGDLVRFHDQEGEVMSVQPLGDKWSVKLAVEGLGSRSLISPPTKFERVDTPLTRALRMDFDSPEEFDLLTQATQLSLAHEHNRLVSLSNSRTKLEPYQVEAVHKVISAWEQRFLIADDVGLGKTVEAGMVIKELKARHRGAKVLIVCPAGLTYQWRREMREKFDEVFEVMTSASLREWRSTRPAGEPFSLRHPHVIVSVDTAKPRDGENHSPDFAEAHWDIVVIDEAHKVSQHGVGQELNQRYKLARDLAPACDALLLLSATPHDGDPNAFHSLLEHIDPWRFASADDIEAAQLEPIMVRRGKADIRNEDGTPLFPPRWVETTPVEFTQEEMHLYEQVTAYVREGYRTASAAKDTAVGFLMVLLQKRMVSSIAAIRKTLERRLIALEHPEAAVLTQQELRELKDREDDEEALSDERRELLQRKLEAARNRLSQAEHKAETVRVGKLLALAHKITVDSKARELRAFIEGVLREKPDEKILVFTEYSDTLDYLRDDIIGDAFGPVAQIYGSLSIEERQEEEARFQTDGCHIMLATDAAGEGLNLQFCHLMVNYELPWNPNRIEQRIGRLHRYGQDRDVRVYNIQVVNTREGIILARLLQKIKTIEEQLGGYAPNVLGLTAPSEGINLNRLSDLIINAIADDTDPEVTAEHVEQALEARRAMSEVLERELFLPLHQFHKPQTDALIEHSRQTLPSNADIEAFVRSYFSVHDGKAENTRTPLVYRLTPPRDLVDGKTVLDTYRQATFDKATAFTQKAGEVQFVAFGHPLLAAIVRDCCSRVPRLRGAAAVKALESPPDGVSSGVLFNYTVRYADAADTNIAEYLVPVFVTADAQACIERGAACLTAPAAPHPDPGADATVQELIALLPEYEQVAREAASQLAAEQFDSVVKQRDLQASACLDSLLRFEKAKTTRLQGSILQFHRRILAGEEMDIAIRRAEHELGRLSDDCEARRSEVEARRSVQNHAPELLNLAVLLPPCSA